MRRVVGVEQPAALELGHDQIEEAAIEPGMSANVTLNPSAAPARNHTSM